MNRSKSFDEKERSESAEAMLIASNGRIGKAPIMFDTDSYWEKKR